MERSRMLKRKRRVHNVHLHKISQQEIVAEEYKSILETLEKYETYFTNHTLNPKNDALLIKRHKQLLSKKNALERNGVIPLKVTDGSTPQINLAQNIETVIDVQWNMLCFSNSKISFDYAGTTFYITIPNARESYNDIVQTFAQRLPPIRIEIKKNIAHIINYIEFNEVVELFEWGQTIFHIERNSAKTINIQGLRKVSAKLIKQMFPLCKTEYISLLQELQDDTIQIIPVFENKNINPDGFLFTIRRTDDYLIIWESNQNQTNKATYVFFAPTDCLHKLQQLIFDYIYSDIPNKRYNLRTDNIREFFGYKFFFIDHDNFVSWKKAILKIVHPSCKKQCGVLAKNEQTISYQLKQERNYIPTHNIIQNKIKTYLDNLGLYVDVLLESDNVDIKAVTESGEWHFFELKTTPPKQCIREALGQILEYAHYPFDNRAKKLYIIGCYELSDNEIRYMNLLRSIYNMPIWYRWFNDKTNCLSEDM